MHPSHAIVMVALSELLSEAPPGSLLADAVAVLFSTLPHSATVVSRSTVTEKEAPLARVPISQSSTSSAPTLMVHRVSGFSAQPVPGRVSSSVTSKASPGPRLVTVMVKLASVPPRIRESPAVFSTTRSGQLTVMVALSSLLPVAVPGSLVAATTAVLSRSTVPSSLSQSAATVTTLTVILLEFISGRRMSGARISPKSQSRASPTRVQSPASVPLRPQVPDTDGRVSDRVTPKAVPGPRLVTVMSKLAFSPALTMAFTASLSTVTSGQLTVMVALSLLFAVEAGGFGSLVASTVAVLSRSNVPETGQSAGSVVVLTVNVLEAPLAMSPNLQLRLTPSPAMEQSLSLVPDRAQVPDTDGSMSVRVTPKAVPGPLLVTMMSKLAFSPALTIAFTASLSTVTSGHSTVMVASSRLFVFAGAVSGSLDAPTSTRLNREPQSAESVTPLITTSKEPPLSRVPKSQPKISAAMLQSTLSVLQSTPAGSVISSRVTPMAIPGPSLVTVMVKLAVSPALIGELSADLATVTSGGRKLPKTISWVSPAVVPRISTDTHRVFRLALSSK